MEAGTNRLHERGRRGERCRGGHTRRMCRRCRRGKATDGELDSCQACFVVDGFGVVGRTYVYERHGWNMVENNGFKGRLGMEYD